MNTNTGLAASAISPLYIFPDNVVKFRKPSTRLRNPNPRTNSTTDPIKSLADIATVKSYLLSQTQRYTSSTAAVRNYVLFVLGINCARRIGDLLKFTFDDFLDENGQFKDRYDIKEQKTGKKMRAKINLPMQEAISMYISVLGNYSATDYLFTSRNGENTPITTRSASKIIKEISRACGLEQKGLNINCHSMRKTWAYHAYIHDKTNIVNIQKCLNHSSQSDTLRYIGIDQEEMDALFDSVNL